MLDQSEVHGSSVAKAKHLQVRGAGGKHPPSECLVAETSTHLASASTSHRGAAASLLDQSEVHGGSVTKANHLQVCGADGTLHSRTSRGDEHTL